MPIAYLDLANPQLGYTSAKSELRSTALLRTSYPFGGSADKNSDDRDASHVKNHRPLLVYPLV